MDVVILTLGVGLGIHHRIGIGRFVPVYLGVANVLPIILTLFLHADRLEEYKESVSYVNRRYSKEEEFDFIVVGGGAAGCVVANRLSLHYRVLLIERGGKGNPMSLVPGLDSTLLSRPETDYMFYTTPQNSSCFACKQQQSVFNAGRGLGGSGILNSMVYLRGHAYDYDAWAFYTKDKRWKYRNVLPYFLRSEDYCFECDKKASLKTPTNEKFHSTGGELPLMKPVHVPLLDEFLEAMTWAKVKIRDQNAPFYYSAANVAVYNQRNSRRSSAYTSFIEPILKRPTLRIWKYTQVIQVLFLPGSNTAYGVKFERFGKIGTVTASKEIIISSGAINTPKILLQSGIGPKRDLEKLNIPVRLKLPVGRNLQDHVGTLVGPILIDKPLSNLFDRDVTYYSALQFLYNGTGALSLPFPAANAFWASSHAVMTGESEWPDVQVGFAPVGVSTGLAEDLSRGYNIREDVLTEFFAPVLGRDSFFLIIDYGRPKSRGTVRLSSTDYEDDPIVDPKYYEDPENEDISVTVDAIQRALYIVENAPVFSKLGAILSPVPFPTCKDKSFRTLVYWECLARAFTLSFHHYSGTASMGPKDSPHAVVDPELKVIGAKNLRIIDASVIPFVTTANTHAPTIMIGERGSAFILEQWKNEVVHSEEALKYAILESKTKRDFNYFRWGTPRRWFKRTRGAKVTPSI